MSIHKLVRIVCGILVILVLATSSGQAAEYEGYSISCPCFTPDGNSLIFVSDILTGCNDILCINLDGTGLQTLAHEENDVLDHPSFSSDGKMILFEKGDWRNTVIWVMDANGANKRQVSSNRYRFKDPTWCPDNRHFLISRTREDSTDIVLMDINGREIKIVVDSGKSDTDPCCSPDGNIVYFISGVVRKRGNIDTLASSIQSATLTQNLVVTALTNYQYYDCDPKVSPAGNKLVFRRDADGDQAGIYTMNTDGTNLFKLPTGYDHQSTEPNWSPDGTRIVFVSCDKDPAHPGDYLSNIYTIKPDGTMKTRVTNFTNEKIQR